MVKIRISIPGCNKSNIYKEFEYSKSIPKCKYCKKKLEPGLGDDEFLWFSCPYCGFEINTYVKSE